MQVVPNLETGYVVAAALSWLLCSVIAGVVAEGKRRSYGRWFLLGLVLGPIAVAIVSRLGEYIPPAERRACPKCGKTIKVTTKRCRHCQAWVAEGEVDRAAQVGYVAARLFQRARQRIGRWPRGSASGR